MLKIENTEVFGWEAAIRGMRNPMNSWDKDDCEWRVDYDSVPILNRYRTYLYPGENNLKLMKNLSKAGDDHGKFLRMINVTVDITAPLYWWKEFDTYKVGTVANSCSTMHKIHAKEFTLDDFSHEHLLSPMYLEYTINTLNHYRELYLQTKDKTYWWQMIQLLPSSYNQKRTVQMNYQVLKAMNSRDPHKLDEWAVLIKWRNELPYFKEICLNE